MTDKTSLRRQLHFGQIIITFSVLVASALGFLINDYKLASRSMGQIVNSTASVISQNLITPLTFQDEREAKKTLESLTGHPIFEGAEVLDKTGKEFARFSKTGASGGFRFSIRHEGDLLGELVLYPRGDYAAGYWAGYSIVLFVVLLGGTLLSLWLSRMTTKNLVRQVDELLGVAHRIRETGDFTLRAKTDQVSTREIANLAAEFNGMVTVVESRNNHIREMNVSLEKTVEERTRELVEAQASLVHSGRMSALGEMSAGIAHEINNPLAMIAGKARKLRRLVDAPEFNGVEAAEALNIIDSTIDRIVKVIKGLKGFTRDGDSDPFENCKLQTMVNDTLEFCSSRFKSDGVDLRVGGIPEDLKVSCRPTQISQVILNLLNNAHDAVETLPEKWVEISIHPNHQWIEIWVTDSGPGIPEHVRQKLMQPFFTTKESGKGTGLGLSISRRIMEAHGGTLTLDPDMNKTKFIARLPSSRVV